MPKMKGIRTSLLRVSPEHPSAFCNESVYSLETRTVEGAERNSGEYPHLYKTKEVCLIISQSYASKTTPFLVTVYFLNQWFSWNSLKLFQVSVFTEVFLQAATKLQLQPQMEKVVCLNGF